MKDQFDIIVGEDGALQFVFDDDLARLFPMDPAEVAVWRASCVEPHPLGGGWLADMGPCGGPILCANGESIETGDTRFALLQPFLTRQAALDAEVAWLRAEMDAGRLVVRHE